MRVTGTKFALSADGNEGSVDVVRGSVALENSSGESVMVRSGEIGRLASGNPPTVSPSPSPADSVAWGENAFGGGSEPSDVHRGLGELVAKKPGESNERRGAVTLTSHAVRVRIRISADEALGISTGRRGSWPAASSGQANNTRGAPSG